LKTEFFKNPHIVIPAVGCLLLICIEFPLWVLAVNMGILLWRFFAEKANWSLPRPWITNSLAVLVFVIVISIYHSLFDREAAPLFFACLCSLKILEYRNQRDHTLIVILLMLLLSSKLMFSIDIWMVPVGIWLVYHMWLSLIPRTESKGLLPWSFRFYFIKVALLSLPLTFLLYFMFPRLNTYLLKASTSTGKGPAIAGFGNEIRPGSVSQLAQSQEIIFRVEMTGGAFVESRQLYWRGLVLRRTDGFRWTQGSPAEDLPAAAPAEESVEYKMTMEPTRERWVFALDQPLQLTSSIPILRARDGVFQASLPFSSRTVINGKSSMEYHFKPKDESVYLKLPPMSPAVTAVVERIKKNAHSRKQIVERIRKYFVDNNFSYTLVPGEMDEHWIDDFLFRAKKGFCEHFSSAFAILARAAGVPSRVVIGYQGAEYNKLGNFFTVRARDAHAWDEFVNDSGEWERTDLVDAVAPIRTEQGAAEFLQLPENLRSFNFASRDGDQNALSMAYEFSTMYLESLNFYWTQWLLDFNLDRQTEILKFLPISFGLILSIFVVIIFLIFVGTRLWSYWSDQKNIVEFLYRRLLRWSLLHGLPKEPWEGPTSFGLRLKAVWPAQAAEIDYIIQNYVNFTYGEQPISLEEIAQISGSIRKLERAPTLRQ
jgi:transglutaminase-like putative cysteine protease